MLSRTTKEQEHQRWGQIRSRLLETAGNTGGHVLMKKRLRKALMMLVVLGIGICAVAIFTARAIILHAARGRTYSDVSQIPRREVGLLLGCSQVLPNGGGNLFFFSRINAAVELWEHRKIAHIIVSGDNHRKGYDEASDMKDALIRRGVPEDRISCDYAGFRTLDSVVRAKAIFGQTHVTVISQAFHNQRAIFIAKRKGIDAIGFNAKDVARRHSFRTLAREQFARVKTVLDIMFGVRPRFYGERIPICPVQEGHEE